MKRIVFGITFAFLGIAGVAFGYHPPRESMSRIVDLSKSLASATEHLYDNAEKQRHHFTPTEERALRRLADLDQQARQFSRQAAAHPDDPTGATDDFHTLVAAYTLASASLDELHPYNDVMNDFTTVQRAMDSLTDEFGGQERFWGRHDGHDGPTSVTIPATTRIGVALRSALRSRQLTSGTVFLASLAEPLIINGRVIAPAGSDTEIRVTELKTSGRSKGRERITFELAGLRIGGRVQSLESSEVTYEAEGSKGKDAKIVGGSAAVGALIGLLTTDDKGEGTAKGAVAGAAAGTGVVLLSRGKTVELPAHHRIDFELVRSVRVRANPEEDDRGVGAH